VIAAIQSLCGLLSRDEVTAAEVAASLGVVAEDRGGIYPIVVEPRDPTLREARIVRQAGTDEPAYVEVVPRQPAATPVSAFVGAFGEYAKLPRLHGNTSLRIAFYPEQGRGTHTCAIICEVTPGQHGIDDGTVARVTVRRDIRLD